LDRVSPKVRYAPEADIEFLPESDGVDAPRRHLSARVEVFEQPLKGGVHGTG
jgi:hypothetical protein